MKDEAIRWKNETKNYEEWIITPLFCLSILSVVDFINEVTPIIQNKGFIIKPEDLSRDRLKSPPVRTEQPKPATPSPFIQELNANLAARNARQATQAGGGTRKRRFAGLRKRQNTYRRLYKNKSSRYPKMVRRSIRRQK